MEFRQDDLITLTREVSEAKRNTIIVLFSSTLLLFWWLKDLVFPIFYDRPVGISFVFIISITIIPLLFNMVAWSVWGIIGQGIGIFYYKDKNIRTRDPFERYELSLIELLKQKRIERKVYLLTSAQFIAMWILLIFGFLVTARVG